MFIFALAGGPCPRAEDFGQNPWVDHLCLKPMRPNVRLDSQLMSTQDVHAFLQPCCTVLPDTPMGIQWGMLPSCQRPLPHRFQGWQGWCTCYAMLGIWEDNATAEPHSVVYVVSWYALRSGVYAMVGSASMLAGFKQMAVAVVVFITGPLSMTLSGVEIS